MILNSLIEVTLILPLLEKLVSLAEIKLWEKNRWKRKSTN